MARDLKFLNSAQQTRPSSVEQRWQSSVSAGAVNEGSGKPLRTVALTAADLTLQKVVAMVACTKEFLDGLLDTGLRALGNELRNGVALGSDEALLTALSGNSSEAQGTPDFSGFLTDLQEALRQIVIAPGSRVFGIVTMDAMKSIAIQAVGAGVNTIGVCPLLAEATKRQLLR